MSIAAAGEMFALDVRGLERLKYQARSDSKGALKEAVRQFEALFLQSMLKSMRDAIPKSELFGDSFQTKFYNSLMDQQWAQHLAGKGIGLSDQLLASLDKQKNITEKITGTESFTHIRPTPPGPLSGIVTTMARGNGQFIDNMNGASSNHNFRQQPMPRATAIARAREFAELAIESSPELKSEAVDGGAEFFHQLEAVAEKASQASGIPAELMLAQAMLETGWGKHQIKTADGHNSYNLFGIKAGNNWHGATTSVGTHEYINGESRPLKAEFRVYSSYQEAFTDYVSLIGNSSRYKGVLNAQNIEQAAWALQQGGYATDPHYAEKLIALINQGPPTPVSG